MTITIAIDFLLSAVASCLMWYKLQLHPLLVILICMAMFACLLVVTHAIFSSAIKSFHKKLDKLLFIKFDENKFEEILAKVNKAGVFNLIKQNYFLFFKNSIDNIAFYDASGATTPQELKGLHAKNINQLKKSFPDISNKYHAENRLRMDVKVFIVDEMQPFLSEYILQNSNKLAGIGKLRCVIEKYTSSVVIPTLLPKGVGLDYIPYLKLLNYLCK